MLRDDARNEAYRDGISRAIRELERRHGAGAARVLDIGTGSGLLAMMACDAGAGAVTACECFSPVARCAALCIADNGLSGAITLVPRASTEMTQQDMRDARRAHLLVREPKREEEKRVAEEGGRRRVEGRCREGGREKRHEGVSVWRETETRVTAAETVERCRSTACATCAARTC
jgi:hypothetical protein